MAIPKEILRIRKTTTATRASDGAGLVTRGVSWARLRYVRRGTAEGKRHGTVKRTNAVVRAEIWLHCKVQSISDTDGARKREKTIVQTSALAYPHVLAACRLRS